MNSGHENRTIAVSACGTSLTPLTQKRSLPPSL